jgi:excisionase family DNA binding protein
MKRDTKAPRPRPDTSEVMTAQEVADYLKLHLITLYRFIKTAGLPGFRLGFDWRFWRADVDKWIAQQLHVRPTGSEPPEGHEMRAPEAKKPALKSPARKVLRRER